MFSIRKISHVLLCEIFFNSLNFLAKIKDFLLNFEYYVLNFGKRLDTYFVSAIMNLRPKEMF